MIEMTINKTALHITLQSLKDNNACQDGYARLVEHLGGDFPLDKPINLITYLASNPVEDVIRALRATVENSDVVARLVAADFAESVLHIFEEIYPDDPRPRAAIAAARAFAKGEIAEEELRVAWDAAWDAARAAWGDAAWAARAAAEAAEAAAGAAAWAARAAAGDVEREKQVEILKKYLS